VLGTLLGGYRVAWTPILLTYFCYGASTITAVAELIFQKHVLGLAPAEAAGIAFWLGLPWSMKMVVGVASDVYPIFGSRRIAYLLLGTACTTAGYLLMATTVATKGTYLAAALLVAVGFMVQDVVADALSVEVADSDEEIGQIQTLGRMALLAGVISVGYLSGWLAGTLGSRVTFTLAIGLPLLVVASLVFAPRERPRPVAAGGGPLGGGRARIVLLVGLGYAALGSALQLWDIPWAQEIVLVISMVLIAGLLQQVGISRGVVLAAIVIFLFRATPDVGQGYSYWAIDRLGFDEKFLGVLAQVGSVLSLVGLLVFRKTIVKRPVSFTLFWVVVASTILYLPSLGLFYGLHEWLGISARTLAFIDTTIRAPLSQLTMVPMLVLIAKSAPRGAEATTFAIMASLMNLALSASQLFTQYLNDLFQVTQQDYSNLGRLMIAVGLIGLVPLLALPLLWSQERGAAGGPGQPEPSEPHASGAAAAPQPGSRA
jgi:BT1 family protein